jgi:hypothetical protein
MRKHVDDDEQLGAAAILLPAKTSGVQVLAHTNGTTPRPCATRALPETVAACARPAAPSLPGSGTMSG